MGWLLLSVLTLSLSIAMASDSTAMLDLAKAINPVANLGWTGSDPCNWKNVDCTNGRVTAIRLPGQNLKGTLPSSINSLSMLSILTLQGNSLSGPLPSFSGMSSLQTLYLDGNQFSSIPGDFFRGLTSLQNVSLDDNPFEQWLLPSDLASADGLVLFSASNASIGGSIPEYFGGLQSLESIRLSYNNLTGGLPASFDKSSLKNLWLNNQRGPMLSGSIMVLGNMTFLTQVWLQTNGFSGSIPDLSGCKSLFDLQLRDNALTGLVPSSLMELQSLMNVSLRNNKLQGPYPQFKDGIKVDNGKLNDFCRYDPGVPCDDRVMVLLEIAAGFGYPAAVADAWSDNDPCSNWLYVTCDPQKKNITVLNFANAKLSGTISPSIGKLSSLRSLILSNNNLTGKIPDVLASMPNLQSVDVENNDLFGEVPNFRKEVTLKTDGNPLLGTTPAPGRGGSGSGSSGGSNSTTPSGMPTTSSITGSGSPTGVIVGVAVGLAVLMLIGVGVIYCVRKKRHQKFRRVQNPPSLLNGGSVPSDLQSIKVELSSLNGNGNASEQHSRASSGPHMGEAAGGSMVISIQVLRLVTNNFSEENILGKGGFGVVYKGELHDGTKIAVKRMEAGVMGKGMNEFQAEIGVLTKVRHRHLVALLGYCVEGNERLLVYEYMPQGTLGQHLFDYAQNGYPPLSWKQRLTIALDVARGVEYLHSLAQKSFIHRDLKPSNVLLGDDMRAKVSDFGLVKLAPDGKYSVETRLAGTFGYLAPEYAVTGRVTTKVDVFAFGVILMELITGRRALDESQPEDSMHLVTWFRRVIANKEKIGKVIDPVIDLDEETYKSICTVAELAGHCTAREPHQRPDMGHAVNVLSPLVQQWKPTSTEDEDCFGIDLDMPLAQVLKRWQANEGTSTMTLMEETSNASIPPKPYAENFLSKDGR
ncbi:hypothetical protein AMTRI_Chr06g195230 [Amborella trichopoda]|uniref:non-specific serine/threonine protein kinase n=1 Tax=Amborella trichopoda TaxID=13333 RepID=W1NP15_AMBTC|nr:receptor protein kinase TMK1 [Amborella trichopoda]ERM97966.1 hypothetical protein AMTR_s00117p00096300 [Amborella trichopoda]|eukprot:XP_006830550.3 receptor protein kinase TMK1 [Amborella trichopoda]